MALVELNFNTGIAEVVLNRPEKRNALSTELLVELLSVLEKVRLDKDVRGVVLKANGSVFSAGGDIKDMESRTNKPITTQQRMLTLIYGVVNRVRELNVPVISLVNGGCYGAGIVLALSADVVFASRSSKFGFAFANIGLIAEGSYFLSRFMGLQRAKFLVFGREVIDASSAQNLGLVLEVIPDEKLEDYGITIMKKWINGPIQTIGLSKRLLNNSFEMTLAHQQELEAAYQGIAFSSSEHIEGATAFKEKRNADFKSIVPS